jgi:hypothetical protein
LPVRCSWPSCYRSGSAWRCGKRPRRSPLEPRLARIRNALLVATVAVVLINGWEGTITAGFRVMAAVALITGGALAVGHLLGGPEPATRTLGPVVAFRHPSGCWSHWGL